MIEGWAKEEYFSLFDEEESKKLTSKYEIDKMLPGFFLIGIIGWDDFLLFKEGQLFRCPTVPATLEYVEKLDQMKMPNELQIDEKLKAKIKWYIKPLVFGGSPTEESNIEWVDYNKHIELVKWWNAKYQEINA